jgi:hypothetical protein
LFGKEILGFDSSALTSDGSLELLRMKLASEPSVHEGKISRVGAATTEDDD